MGKMAFPARGTFVSVKWDANNLRFTFFPTQPVQVTPEWWLSITGEQPDAENVLPKEQVVSVSGAYKGVQLSISSSPGRVDFVIQPLAPQPGRLGSPVAGAADELLEVLGEVVSGLADGVPNSNRLALGGVLLRPSSSKEETYGLLKETLKSVAVNPEKMSDLNYRVNWPVEIESRGYNRLGTWSSILAKSIVLAPDGTTHVGFSEAHYLSFEFDINTMPQAGLEIRSSETVDAYRVMAELVRQNMEQGEVPSK
jgi:hypothetical protein